MKKLLIITGLLTTFSTQIFAKDNFSGPYVGFQLGYGDGRDRGYESLDGESNGYTQKTSPGGILLGVNAGFNKVFQDKYLLGFEADLEGRHMDHQSLQIADGVYSTEDLVKTKIAASASLRLKAGYLFNETSLGYLTTGLASAKIKRSFSYIDNDDDDGIEDGCYGCTISQNSWQTGWTVSAGFEKTILEKLSARIEYRYSDFGSQNINTQNLYAADSPTSEKQSYTENTLRMGLNYHF